MANALIPLRRNLRIQTFWTASVGATLGQAVGGIVYPLAIVTMTGSPGKAALFSALLVAGMLVAGLPAGSLADRYDSQRLALVACAIRTVVAVVVAVALAGGWLTLPLLLVAVIILGAGQALGSAANMLLRLIVPGEQLTLALTQDEVRINGASLAVPSLAGVLYGLAHVAPFAFTAAAFFVALAGTPVLPLVPVSRMRVWARSCRPKGAFGLLRNGAADGPSEGADAGAGAGASQGARAGEESAGSDGGMLAGLRELWERPVLRATVPPGVLLLAVCAIEVPVLALLAVPLGPWWAAGCSLPSLITGA